ncbi:MAG TPA: glutathione S-transferase family protein [Nevskiaceae bacterium]|nr:glutathione S-transferase family protein [Nevskiaceae bacterium]
MLRLYDNAFSPFARKVRMVLHHKGLAHETVDGLRKSTHAALASVNGRVEVPALDHDGLLIVNSADIVAYLERVFPDRPVYPAGHAAWVKARAWERCADTTIDPICIDISYWTWAERPDAMPDGLLAAARRDLDAVYAALEAELATGPYVCGELSIADLALFPHLVSVRPLGVGIDEARFPRLTAWLKRMRALPIAAADIARTKAYLRESAGDADVERRKIFWRGDRIEWILARGHHAWFVREIEEGRVIWPGLGVPR